MQTHAPSTWHLEKVEKLENEGGGRSRDPLFRSMFCFVYDQALKFMAKMGSRWSLALDLTHMHYLVESCSMSAAVTFRWRGFLSSFTFG